MWEALINLMTMCILELVTCPHAPNITGGTFKSASNFLGSVGRVSCNLPYVIEGDIEYICSSNSLWIGNIQCGKMKKLILCNYFKR